MIERYECYLASDHNITFTKENLGNWCKYKDVQKLEQQNQKLSDLVFAALGCNPDYTDQVACVLKKLKQIQQLDGGIR